MKPLRPRRTEISKHNCPLCSGALIIRKHKVAYKTVRTYYCQRCQRSFGKRYIEEGTK